MVDQTEMFARHVVRALAYSTDGKPFWWSLPKELNETTRKAIDCAVDRGWILLEGHYNSVCLTDEGRKLVKRQRSPNLSDS